MRALINIKSRIFEGKTLATPSRRLKNPPLEKQIDKLVYELYSLTPEEIDIIEGFNDF